MLEGVSAILKSISGGDIVIFRTIGAKRLNRYYKIEGQPRVPTWSKQKMQKTTRCSVQRKGQAGAGGMGDRNDPIGNTTVPVSCRTPARENEVD